MVAKEVNEKGENDLVPACTTVCGASTGGGGGGGEVGEDCGGFIEADGGGGGTDKGTRRRCPRLSAWRTSTPGAGW